VVIIGCGAFADEGVGVVTAVAVVVVVVVVVVMITISARCWLRDCGDSYSSSLCL